MCREECQCIEYIFSKNANFSAQFLHCVEIMVDFWCNELLSKEQQNVL